MPNSAIVLVIDRLGAGYLGPYGCTWLETPALNQLASQSLLVETCLAESPDLQRAYDKLWGGTPSHLPTALTTAGLHTALLTDEAAVAEHPYAAPLHERNVLTPGAAVEATSVEETSLAALFAAAAEWLQGAREPFLLWIHAQGMQGAWDAPWDMRGALADEEDPPPPRFVAPPTERHTAEIDPDHRLGLAQAYAAQVQVLDECLGRFLAAMPTKSVADQPLFILTAPRGYPLGEHGCVGSADEALYAELIQVPLLLRLPDRVGAAARTQQIFQLGDVASTVRAWCLGTGISDLLTVAHSGAALGREVGVSSSRGQRALRTPAWFLREDLRGSEPVRELFVKPDDRFEVNEIASRGGEIVEQMLAQLAAAETQAATGERLTLLPEMESLRNLWR